MRTPHSVDASGLTPPVFFEALEARLLLDGAPAVPAVPPAADGTVTRRALMVGVTDGPVAWDYAYWDITTMQTALVNRGGWEEVIVLTGMGAGVPTVSNVESQFSYLKGLADDDDLTLFYFTGHGDQIADEGPFDEADGFDEVLCFYDEDMTDDELAEIIGPDWPGQFVAIFDSCFSGGMLDGGMDPAAVVSSGELLAACRADESGWGDYTIGSYFTYFLADALDEGADSVREMYDHARPLVILEAPEPQHPLLSDTYDGEIYLLPDSASGDAMEPNDSVVTAAYLGVLDDTTVTNLSLHEPGNEDFYSLTARASGLLHVDLSFAHALGDLDLYLYNQSLDLVASSRSAEDNESVSELVSAGQVYYLRVVGVNGATNRDYELAVNGPGAAGDIHETNNSTAQATHVDPFVHFHERHLSIHNGSDHDYFRIRPIENGPFEATIRFDHSLGDLDMELIDPTRPDPIVSESTSDVERVATNLSVGHTYYLHVYGYNRATNPNYELEMSAPGPQEDALERNDSFPEATFLGTLGNWSESGLSVHLGGNEDWYSFTAVDDGTLTVDLLFLEVEGDLDLAVYDAAQSLLGESRSHTDNEQVSVAVTAGEGYRVCVAGWLGSTNANYELVLDGPEKQNLVPPVAAPNVYGVSEDNDLAVNVYNGVLGNDTDDDLDPLTAVLVDDVDHGTLTLHDDGSLTYQPEADFNGPDEFTYTAFDGQFSSNEVTVTINVMPVNDAPVADPGAVTLTEDIETDVVLTGSDLETPAGDLVFAIDTQPEHGQVLPVAGGTFRYLPEADFYGADSFTFTVTDDGDPAGSGLNPGGVMSEPATVTVTVEPVDDVPRAADDEILLDEDAVLLLDPTDHLFGNDYDEDLPALPVEILQDVTLGTLVPNGDGTFTYTPPQHGQGDDTFTYRIFDGTAYSDPAVATIHILPVNDVPVGHAQDVIAAEDGTATIVLTGEDVETPAGELVYAIGDGPAHGQVELVGDTVTYTPEPGHHGVDTFTFTVTDTGDPAGSYANPGEATSEPVLVQVYIPMTAEAGEKINYYDADGDWITVLLRGEGTVGVYLPGWTWCDADHIVVSGSDARTTLTITATGRRGQRHTSVGDVTITGSLNALNAPTTDLRGDLTMTGTLRTMKLDTVAEDHHIDVNTDMLADPARDRLNVTLGRVADTWFDTHGLPVKQFTVTEWLDGDGDGDAGGINAPHINRLRAAGSRKRDDLSAGDFAADVNLSGEGVADRQWVLNNATVAGAILGGAWTVPGVRGVNVLRAGGGTADTWSLDAAGEVNVLDGGNGGLGGAISAAYFNRVATRGNLTAALTATGAHERRGTGVGSLTAGSAVDALVTCLAGGVGSARLVEWIDGNGDGDAGGIDACWLGSLRATGHRRTGRDGDFAADLTLSGVDLPGNKPVLGGTHVAGDVQGSTWALNGRGTSIAIRGAVDNWTAALTELRSLIAGAIGSANVTVEDSLGTCKALCWLDGLLDVNTLRNLQVTGKRARDPQDVVVGDFGADLLVRGQNVDPRRNGLNAAHIAGTLRDNTCQLGASAGRLVVGAMENAEVLVGCAAATGAPEDFVDGQFHIRSLTLKGVENEYFTNSTLAAWAIDVLRFARRNAEATGTIQCCGLGRLTNAPLQVGDVLHQV